MKKISFLLVLLISIATLPGCLADNSSDPTGTLETKSTEETESTEKMTVTEAKYDIRRSMEMNSFNRQLSTAKCTESDNAADFSSLLIEAQQGDRIIFENVNLRILILKILMPRK